MQGLYDCSGFLTSRRFKDVKANAEHFQQTGDNAEGNQAWVAIKMAARHSLRQNPKSSNQPKTPKGKTIMNSDGWISSGLDKQS